MHYALHDPDKNLKKFRDQTGTFQQHKNIAE